MDEFGNVNAAMTMKGFFNSPLAQTDPEVAGAINDELERQQDQIEMIASENIISPNVKRAINSDLHGRYAEGLPGKRYYQVVKTLTPLKALE